MLHEDSLFRELFQVFLLWQLIILVKRLWTLLVWVWYVINKNDFVAIQQVAVLSVWKYTEILLEGITFYPKYLSLRGDLRETKIIEIPPPQLPEV